MRARLVAIFVLFFSAAAAVAHPLLQNVIWIKFGEGRVQVAVDASVREISLAEGLSIGESVGAIDEALSAAAEKHAGYVIQHLDLELGGAKLTGHLTRVSPPAQVGFAEDTKFQYELEYPMEKGREKGPLVIGQSMLREFSYSPGQPWDVTYQVRYQVIDGNGLETALLLPNHPLSVPMIAASHGAGGLRTFVEYFQHGVMHILTGYDHLLFVSALVLAAMSFLDMVKVIAAFTLAHTVTLTLSVLNIFRLPSFIVEPVISASIIFVAVENIFFPKRAKSWARLAVAFGFGLVHGLGFAGGLLDAMQGLPALSLGLALLAFSIGVEVGHQTVVLPLFGALKLGQARWTDGFRAPVMRYGSICISLAGVYYLIIALKETAGGV